MVKIHVKDKVPGAERPKPKKIQREADIIDINEPGTVVRGLLLDPFSDVRLVFRRVLDSTSVINNPVFPNIQSGTLSLSVVGRNGYKSTCAHTFVGSSTVVYAIDPRYIRENKGDFRFVGVDNAGSRDLIERTIYRPLGGVPYGVEEGRKEGDNIGVMFDELRCYARIHTNAVVGLISDGISAGTLVRMMEKRVKKQKRHLPIYLPEGDLLWHPEYPNGLTYEKVKEHKTLSVRD